MHFSSKNPEEAELEETLNKVVSCLLFSSVYSILCDDTSVIFK